jgi:hypothetical protein
MIFVPLIITTFGKKKIGLTEVNIFDRNFVGRVL